MSFWQWVYSVFTGRRLYYCANHNWLKEWGPIPQGHDGWEMHTFWSGDEGAWLWSSAVTKSCVCSRHQCIEHAKKIIKDHDEAFADPVMRRELHDVMQKVGRCPGLNYDLSATDA